jgi:hypothetical protein
MISDGSGVVLPSNNIVMVIINKDLPVVTILSQ